MPENPLTAGRVTFTASVTPSAPIPLYAALKLVSSGVYTVCATTDTDEDVVAIALTSYNVGDQPLVLACAEFNTPLPLLSDGSATIAAGDLLTLSGTVGGRFKSASTGIFVAQDASAATQDLLVPVLAFLGSNGVSGTIASGQIPIGTGADTLGASGLTFGVDGVFGAGYYLLAQVASAIQLSFFNSDRTGWSLGGASNIFGYVAGVAYARLTATLFGPVNPLGIDLGSDTVPFSNAYVQSLTPKPMAAPAAPSSGKWVLYIDSGDGNKLKAKASTGTVVTLGTP